MTEVGSMPPPSGGHGRTNGSGGGVPRSNGNGLANGGIEIDPTQQGSVVDFAFKQQRPESTMTQKSNTALFVQATNVPNSSSDSTFIHNSSSESEDNRAIDAPNTTSSSHPLEEDHTIVIDLTEDGSHQRCYQSSGSGVSHAAMTSSALPPTPPLTTMLSNVSSSLDAQPPTEDEEASVSSPTVPGDHTSEENFLIRRMLNGADEEDGKTISNGGESLVERSSKSMPRLPGLEGSLLMLRGDEYSGEEEDEDDEDDKNLSDSPPTEKFVDIRSNGVTPIQRPKQLNLLRSHQSKSLDPDSAVDCGSQTMLEETPTSSSTATTGERVTAVPSAVSRKSRSLGRRAQPPSNLSQMQQPFSLFGSTSQTLYETRLPPTSSSGRFQSVHRSDHRSLERRQPRAASQRGGAAAAASLTGRTRKAKSNDFLDRMDVSQSTSSGGGRRKNKTSQLQQQQLRVKMSKIDKGLFLGNMEAATDVILLESHAITHIVTLDSVPLPRKISSFLPRIANLHLQVSWNLSKAKIL